MQSAFNQYMNENYQKQAAGQPPQNIQTRQQQQQQQFNTRQGGNMTQQQPPQINNRQQTPQQNTQQRPPQQTQQQTQQRPPQQQQQQQTQQRPPQPPQQNAQQKQQQQEQEAAAQLNLIKETILKMKTTIAKVIPRHMSADSLINAFISAVEQDKNLQACTLPSLQTALLNAARIGLEPGMLGYCYILPRNRNFKDSNNQWQNVKEARMQIGYRGMIELVYRTGKVVSIISNEVYQDDEFIFEYGTQETLKHIPNIRGNRSPNNIIAFYAYARLKEGGHVFTVMFKNEVDAVRDNHSQAKDRNTGNVTGPWRDHYVEMAKKTAIKDLIRYMPISTELINRVAEVEAEISEELEAIEN